MTITVTFIDPRGRSIEAAAEPGDNLLRVGQAAGLPLEGTCEGQMACSTCHVIVAAEWFDRLPPLRRRRRTCSISPPACAAPRACRARSS